MIESKLLVNCVRRVRRSGEDGCTINALGALGLLIAAVNCTPISQQPSAVECAADAACDAETAGAGDGASNTGSVPAGQDGGATAANGGATASGVAAASGSAAMTGGLGATAGAGAGMGAAATGASPAGSGAAGPAGPGCGNGTIDPGETCDPIAMCPTMTTCRSPDACLSPMVMGSASSCTATCEQVEIVTCVPGDGCCPKDCNNALDSDCSVSCGDGVVTGGETCEAGDPNKPCPESCDDMDPCTKDMKTGTPAQCNVVCTHMPILAPAPGDKCCPPGANAANDSDCMTKCGDGVVTGSETCDPSGSQPCETRSSCQPNGCMGATFSGDPTTCTAKCDRKMITARQAGDGCCPPNANQANDSDCPQKCGDGVKTGSETCDPCESQFSCLQLGCVSATYTGSALDCTGQCTRGTVRTPEDGDGCCPSGANIGTDSDCSARCGDGVVSSGETCDSGPGGVACITQTACMSGSGSGCPRYTGSTSACTAKCSYDGSMNACGGCKTLQGGTPGTDCLSFLNEPSCLSALWRCDSDLIPGTGSHDQTACSCQARM